jgi:hypothetical protein
LDLKGRKTSWRKVHNNELHSLYSLPNIIRVIEASGQLHALTASPPGKETRYPRERMQGGPQSQYGRGGEKEINPSVTGIEPRFPSL